MCFVAFEIYFLRDFIRFKQNKNDDWVFQLIINYRFHFAQCYQIQRELISSNTVFETARHMTHDLIILQGIFVLDIVV